jgi:hypothetical protein
MEKPSFIDHLSFFGVGGTEISPWPSWLTPHLEEFGFEGEQLSGGALQVYRSGGGTASEHAEMRMFKQQEMVISTDNIARNIYIYRWVSLRFTQ